jgi:hypothetical protein
MVGFNRPNLSAIGPEYGNNVIFGLPRDAAPKCLDSLRDAGDAGPNLV